MEETRQPTGQWIASRDVRAFVEVAVGAVEGEVREYFASVVLSGDNVIYLMANPDGRLRKPAIVTTVPCPLPDSLPEVVGHRVDFARLSESRALD